jgi:hypothetical protein
MRLCFLLTLSTVGLTACQASHAMHLPEAPVAREVYPDHDGYRRFRADAGPSTAVTVCMIDGVGLVPTFA